MEPLLAILNSYGLSDFESSRKFPTHKKFVHHLPRYSQFYLDWTGRRAEGYPEGSVALKEIQHALEAKPAIPSYHIPNGKTHFAGLCPGDPRSELVLRILESPASVPFLLDGFQAESQSDKRSQSRVASISLSGPLRSLPNTHGPCSRLRRRSLLIATCLLLSARHYKLLERKVL